VNAQNLFCPTQLRPEESKLPNSYKKSYPRHSYERVGPQLLSRTPLSARPQHAKLLPPKTFDRMFCIVTSLKPPPKFLVVEAVLFQEFAEQIC
jgi:hypothetical protein